jgi:hypothetical protein
MASSEWRIEKGNYSLLALYGLIDRVGALKIQVCHAIRREAPAMGFAFSTCLKMHNNAYRWRRP